MSYVDFRILLLMFHLLLLYIIHTIYTANACTSNIPRVTNLPVSKDGTVKILTTVQDTIRIPSTWCVDLADKIEINGTSAILENVQRIEIKLSSVTATHVSGVTGASLVNLPADTDYCGDSRDKFCVLTQEVCGDHTYPEFYHEPLKAGYKDAKTEYWGNKCGCSGGINCYGNYHQTTRVFMPPSNFVRAWVMSNSFNYQFEIDTGGLLYNSNTSSRWISYGTEGITHLSNDAGFEVIIVLADQMTGKFPERAVFIQDSGQTGQVKYVPFSWGTQGTLGCLDPSIPGWSSAAAYSFEQAKEEATECFRNQMRNIGWSFWLSSQRQRERGYVVNDISAAGPISERINLIKSSRFVGTDKLTAVHTLGNIVVDIFIRFPERKVIAYQDTGRCRLKSCSKTISDTVSSVTLNCVCAQSTPGILKVNSTDLNTNAYSETSISLGMLDDKFELPLALNATSKILICTVYNCVNAEITWVIDDTSLRRSNLTNKPNPLAPDHSNSGGKFTAGSWFSDVFSFRSLLSLISCISSGDISCIVGSLFGAIINLLMLIGICILLKKAYRHYAASNNNKSNVVRIVSETKKHNDEVELTANPAVTTAETKV